MTLTARPGCSQSEYTPLARPPKSSHRVSPDRRSGTATKCPAASLTDSRVSGWVFSTASSPSTGLGYTRMISQKRNAVAAGEAPSACSGTVTCGCPGIVVANTSVPLMAAAGGVSRLISTDSASPGNTDALTPVPLANENREGGERTKLDNCSAWLPSLMMQRRYVCVTDEAT